MVFVVGYDRDVVSDAILDVKLFDPSVRTLTIEQNARSPRRIKRFINAFSLEYGLDTEWETMGVETLVRVLIIDVYFPDFGRLLRARQRLDPVADFHNYVAVRDGLR
jgi:hypothetical protein